MSEKIVIASDIHGSAYWCQKLLDAFEKENASRLLLLGDLLYHGPRNPFPNDYSTQSVSSLLNGVKDKITAVRGNCDSEVDQMVLEFPMLADYALVRVDGHTLFATHGHLFNETVLPPMGTCDVLLNGHFHVPKACALASGGIYANCGSVALPKSGTPHSYIVYENGVLTWKNLENGESFLSHSITE